MCRASCFRDRLALICVVVCLSATAVLGIGSGALGQPPGPDTFLKDPETPLELWEAADYLVRSGQTPLAVPYLNKFLKSKPDDDVLLAIRDRYGVGSILRLGDHPETQALARPLAELLNAAVRRTATRADRIDRFVATLTKSREEQDYAVERLREAGPYAVPILVQALDEPGLSAGDRVLVVRNAGRLGMAAVPPLIATLDSDDSRLVADVADILGAIGDARAMPALTIVAARNDAVSPAGVAARRAIVALTGRPLDAQTRAPVRILTDEARRYHVHAIRFPSEQVLVWIWDPARKVPAPRPLSRSEAEAYFGLRLVREALALEPANVPAQVVMVSLALEKAAERAGIAAFLAGTDPSGAYSAAVATGPNVLGQVLRTAISDGKMDLAAIATTALGQVTDRDVLANGRRVPPLVEALSAPGRRVQFAASKALVLLEPRRPFAGSSQVVPTLARFVINQAPPRAIIIDGNPARGGQLAGFAKAIGYEPTLTATGAEGFRAAAESADVELILLDVHLIQGEWRLVDTLANLRADARTAGVSLALYGPLSAGSRLNGTLANYPGVRFLVTPTSPELLEQQLGSRPEELSEAERAAYAQGAAALLASITSRPGSPFEADLRRVEPALALALNTPPTSLAASSALGDVPDASAQRALADVVLDPAKPAPLRLSAAGQLARSIQRFGPLVSADQEPQLLAVYGPERDPALRAALGAVVGALRPKPAAIGQQLRQYDVSPGSPAQANPAPEAAPSPPTPETPPPAAAEAPAAPADAKP